MLANIESTSGQHLVFSAWVMRLDALQSDRPTCHHLITRMQFISLKAAIGRMTSSTLQTCGEHLRRTLPYLLFQIIFVPVVKFNMTISEVFYILLTVSCLQFLKRT